ncbi:hypothetical protein HQ529_01115 [Candidatus Woesearchaeota archaeon]|nr:hypothetical protein [Candidatus Woesearchaeota archaeon]
MKTKKTNLKNYDQLKLFLLVVLGVVLLWNIFTITNLNSKVDEKMGTLKEAAKPAKVELFVLKDSRCSDCFDIDAVLDNIKKANIEVTEEKTIELDSDEGKELVEKYKIEKLPTVIINGETEKVSITGMETNQDALVFTSLNPPYVDSEGNVIGKVSVTYLVEPSCDDCGEPAQLVTQFKGAGVFVFKEKYINSNTEYGAALIEKYNIDKLPTIIFSEDIGVYKIITENWAALGTVESDGMFITRTAQAVGIPFYDLNKNKVMGLVDIKYIIDESCEDCYDVNIHKSILVDRFGIKVGEETTLDVSSEEGASLVEMYNITAVPTVVLSEDSNAYPTLRQAWLGVGSIEEDGSFIFRSMAAMTGSVYKNLITGEVLGK